MVFPRSKTSFAEDYAFGKMNEDDIKLCVRTLFDNKEVEQSKKKFAPFDFHTEDNSHFAELKTRRVCYNAYPTTLITTKKIDHAAAHPESTFFFLFRFTDGLYYIQYNPEVFETFESMKFKRFARADHYDKSVEHTYIPIEALTKLEIEEETISPTQLEKDAANQRDTPGQSSQAQPDE